MIDGYIKGRGAQQANPNKFLKNFIEYDESVAYEQADDGIKTTFYKENPKKIVNKITSPDLGFAHSMNPYQGCEHGCIYCYARNSHEYWGFNSGTDFESKVIVKDNAANLLEEYFLSGIKEVLPIALSGNTDCYQPAERRFGLTREILKVFVKYRYPVSLITKNSLVLRDIDLLEDLSRDNLVHVMISITSQDEKLRRVLEPRTSSAKNKFKTLEKLSKKGIPTGVMTAPIIPGLNHHEIPQLLKAAADSGAQRASYTVVRLNGAISELFKDWLMKNFPDRYDKVLHQIEGLHGGKLNDSEFGRRMKGEGPYASIIKQLFNTAYKKYFDPSVKSIKLNTGEFRRGGNYQLF
ncbi:MAG: PA0069 family radical SAM protein [Cyclobacteriaceae bacterium]